MTARRRILLAEIVAKMPQASVPATWNPADKAAAIVLGGGNLTATKSTTGFDWACVRGTNPMLGGQWYWETTHEFSGTCDFATGIGTSSIALTTIPGRGGYKGSYAVQSDGSVMGSWLSIESYGSIGALSSGDVVRHWLDLDSQVYRVARNGGAWLDVPIKGSAGFFPITGIMRELGADVSCVANFGAAAFVYPVPDGVNPGVYTVPDAEPVSIYLASEAFATTSRQYDARIAGDAAGDVEIERQGSCFVWGSQSVSRRGKLVLINADGALDAWAGWEWRDASVHLRAGYAGDDLSAFVSWAYSRVDSITFTDALRVELTLADPLALLDRALQAEIYPDDQPNAQLAGKPLPIVYGAPMYCTAARLNSSALVRDYQLHDGLGGITGVGGFELDSIADIYDNGDRLAGPDDSFTAHTAITAANGGNFTNWSGSPSVPSGWLALTPFIGSDRFIPETGAGPSGSQLRMLSGHQPATAMQHSETLHARGRYRITFDTATITTAGIITFAVGSVTVPYSITAAGTGLTTVIDVAAAGPFELRMDGTPLATTMRNLRVSAEQVIDWTYYMRSGLRLGFNLSNAPVGKIVANPVSAINTLHHVIVDVCNNRLELPGTPAGEGVLTSTASAISTAAPYQIAAFIDAPKTALAFLREVLDGWCGWVATNRYGQIVFGRVTPPSSVAAVELDRTNVMGEVTVSDDRAKGLTLKLAGRRNYSPHSDSELSTSVTPAMRAELQTAMTIVRVGAPLLGAEAISAAYVQAVNAPARDTLLQRAEDLQAEANRIATLWRQVRKFYQLAAVLDASTADQLEPGQTVRLTWPRYGLESGRNLLVVGVRSRFFSRRVDLLLWG